MNELVLDGIVVRGATFEDGNWWVNRTSPDYVFLMDRRLIGQGARHRKSWEEWQTYDNEWLRVFLPDGKAT